MKVLVLVKATESSEAGEMPSTELMEAMTSFNEELVKAGVMQDGDGLRPSRDGVRIRFDGASRTVREGPFTPAGELVAGYWIWTVGSMAEAIDWAKRCPNPMPGPSELELRPFYEIEDFGDAVTPELRARWEQA